MPGLTIVGPTRRNAYMIGAALDSGSFGQVYECTDAWQRPLVAKVIKPSEDWQNTEARTVSEAVAMAIARCPETVHVYDTFVYRGAFYIISERCDVTVRDLLNNPRVTPSFFLKPLAKCILSALEALHQNGIAHCDVHAGNVFIKFIPDAIDPDDFDRSVLSFKLGDFGCARMISEMSPKGTFLRTAMPPEAINEREFGPLDDRADLYQAGLLFLAFLTGEERKWSRKQIVQGRPRQLAESIGSPVAIAVSEMLRRHADCRPRTALDAWLAIDAAFQAN